jgi:hypothetical protein
VNCCGARAIRAAKAVRETNGMTTSAIIAALDVAGILCLVGAVAFAAVVIAELWWRHMGAMEAVKAGLPPRTRAGGQANAVSGRIDARSLR